MTTPAALHSLPPSVFQFLEQLKKNNNRDWFAAQKERYLAEAQHLQHFAEALLQALRQHDVIETADGKKSLHRIYRDTRFSKDKTPYKTNWSGGFTRAGKERRGSYYFHLERGNCFVAGGFWGPNPPDLKRIRDELAWDPLPLRRLLKQATFKKYFGELTGERLKTTPKGYAADDAAIDLLRYKQFLLVRRFTDQEALQPDFVRQVSTTFRAMRPFFDYMSMVLSSNANGQNE